MGVGLEPTREGDVQLAVEEPFRLDSGGSLQPVTVRYAMYGQLSPARDNVILVCHALSGSARAADWWPEMFGAEGLFDTSRYCILGTNLIGSCYGSTGPASINPNTGRPYGPDFPLVSITDMVRAQAQVLNALGIERVRVAIGGSIGGMQALEWAVDYPERVERAIAIGAAPLSAMGLGLNHLQRQAIQLDPGFRDGRYSETEPPARGLALARAIAMCSYKSAELFTERYARRPNRNGEDPWSSFADRFDVAGYLDHQGEKFVDRFDANSYIVLSKAMDTFEPGRGYDSEAHALGRIRARVLLVGIASDWLFPPEDVRALAGRMRAAGAAAEYVELQSNHGHDGFLADMKSLVALIRDSFHGPASQSRTARLALSTAAQEKAV